MLANSKIIVIFIVGIFSWLIHADNPITTKEFAKNTIEGLPVDSQSFSKAYMSPMIGEKQLSTPSGTKFDVSLSCPTSNAFLEVMAQTSSTGDISFLQFSRDKDVDGVIDSVKRFPKMVSGVCTTGLISCTPGTWSDCVGYKWNGKDDNLSLIETGIGNLGGCYCINQSCGDSSRSQRIISSIVTDLGTAAASALANNNPQYSISGAQTTGSIAKFYGQKLVGCGEGSATTMASYYQNPQNIESAANSYKTDANGIYQLIANSDIAKNSLTTRQFCTINRNTSDRAMRLSDIVSYSGGDGGVHSCAGDGCLELTLGRIGNDYWSGYCDIRHQKVSFYVNMPERIKRATLVSAKWDDWIRVSVNNQKLYAYPYPDWDGQTIDGKRCEWSTSWSARPNVNFTDLIKQKGRIDFKIDVQIAGSGEGYAYAQVLVDESCGLDQEWIANSCEVIDEDKNCKLKNETIDGVQTYKDYHPTGKTPIASERSISNSCDAKIKRNWWKVEREYECITNSEFDFSKGIARNAIVQTSAKKDGFNDVINGVTKVNELILPDIETQSNCTNACKVKRKKDKVSVSAQGPVTNRINEDWEILYRKCTGENQNICPNEAGEQVTTSCSCLNEFDTASTMMQSLRQAAQELICSK
ncbi:hypothetical protein MS2017_1376 [Bathymodiolus thermophilus thioautotrophic gill symbiont]|uniref:Conjugal transfer protein TraN n=1 Tax=Bathymodiolus thermophilus thioautotrophic gill symbiont TaxID=2360 RepID=A0A3G3INB1_9GAMM|nr:hypothetical protein [Bathymodiolus thermophilus thioautotrophic gill symbiont]AYQ57064.1 hypothetical protein MS2017_1376 [Bathymodiolus thermophilus thioautotrophic gill symbiont]